MSDVVVVGGGMAGAIAALAATKAGARVTLFRRSLGATAVSSGAVDVATDVTAPPGDLKAHLTSFVDAAARLARQRPHHPYAVVKDDLRRLPEAMRFATQALDGLWADLGDTNALFATPLGTVKPAAIAQRPQQLAAVERLPEHVAVVQLWLTPAVDAQLVARGLERSARELGRTMRASIVESRYFREIEDALRHPHELAERLEVPSTLEAFGAELRRQLPTGVETVLLPPVLGRSRSVADRLAELLGVPCAELLSLAPSVPGLRLQASLDRALAKSGVVVHQAEVDAGAARSRVFAAGEQQFVRATGVVLATGKYIGGGIRRDERFFEPLFDLPVFAGTRAVEGEFIGDLLGDSLASEQLAFRAGVRVDPELRPVGRDGTAAYPWLFAAGSVLAGYDPALDKTGLGVAVLTGYLAGQRAAQVAM